MQGLHVLSTVYAVAGLSYLPLVGTDEHLGADDVWVRADEIDLEPVVTRATLVHEDVVFAVLVVVATSNVGVDPTVLVEVGVHCNRCSVRTRCRHQTGGTEGEDPLAVVEQNDVHGLTALQHCATTEDVEVGVVVVIGERHRTTVVGLFASAHGVDHSRVERARRNLTNSDRQQAHLRILIRKTVILTSHDELRLEVAIHVAEGDITHPRCVVRKELRSIDRVDRRNERCRIGLDRIDSELC